MRAGLSKILASVAIGVACLAPLPYGSDAFGWICVWLGILAVCMLIRIWTSPPPARQAPVLVAAALGVGLVVVVVIQVTPGLLPGLNHAAWGVAAENGIAGAQGRISVDAVAPLYALVLPLTILVAFSAGYLYTSRRSRCWTLIKAFTLAGIAYAALGICIGTAYPGYVLFEHKTVYENDFTGTFVNRNTAASYFGVCLLAALTLAFRQWRTEWPDADMPLKEKALVFVANLSASLILWSCVAAGLLVALMLTSSRAGAACAVVAVVCLLGLLIRKLGPGRRKAFAVSAVVCGLLMLHLFGTGNIVTRVNEGLNENGRYLGWLSSWDIVRDYPYLGTGLGTFRVAYPAYRQDSRGITQIWERAHSTPLEIAVELGLPAAMLALVLAGGGIWSLWRRYDREEKLYSLPALALSVCILCGLHSLVDFPLQVAGFVVPIAIILGAISRQTQGVDVLRRWKN